MSLSPDTQALLELILKRGQSYADIGALLEVPEPEVRTRAREALSELGGADPDRNVGLTDWILGQADPITRADAARHLREDAEDNRLASELIAALRELAPDAELPKVPGAPAPGRGRRRAAAGEPAPVVDARPEKAEPEAAAELPSRLSSLTSHQSRLIIVLGSAAVLLVAVVLAVSGVFGGDDDDSTAAGDSDTTTAADTPTEDIQTVPLRASGGGDAEGSATFGIAGGSQAFVDLDISNLEPAPSGKAYVLWLLVSEEEGHPLTPFQVSQNGTYSEQIPIASFLTQLAARTRFVDVSLSPRKPLLEEVGRAVDAGTPIIDYTGETILRGSVEATGESGAGTTTTPEQ